jgi:hypothetical protein
MICTACCSLEHPRTNFEVPRARRKALEDHVYWSAPMGALVLINGDWYKLHNEYEGDSCHLLNKNELAY